MESEQIIEICQGYIVLLSKDYEPIRAPDDLEEYCQDNKTAWLNHAYYMAQVIPTFIAEYRREKAMRWLGYLQCLLNMSGVITLKDAKKTNMPLGSKYNREA